MQIYHDSKVNLYHTYIHIQNLTLSTMCLHLNNSFLGKSFIDLAGRRAAVVHENKLDWVIYFETKLIEALVRVEIC